MKDRSRLLEAKNLRIGYNPGSEKEVTIAGPLDLTMRSGELICLLGPNGAGKSTLIRSLAGLQPMLAGTVEIDSENIHKLKPTDLARKLSMILTDNVRTSNLSVYSVVALGRYPYTGWLGNLTKADKEIIHWAIEAVDIAGFVNRKLHELSDGECQKVMLARALAQDTPVVILDEPTAHLDLPNRVLLMQLLHHLARKTNKAILLSTHELDLALQAADQVWIINPQGKMTIGVPEDLVLNGTFEAAFDKAGFYFDKSSGTFNIHQGKGPTIHLIGEPALTFWTKRALQREGYAVSTESETDAFDGIQIEALADGNAIRWISRINETYKEHPNIGVLLAHLKAIEPKPSQESETVKTNKSQTLK